MREKRQEREKNMTGNGKMKSGGKRCWTPGCRARAHTALAADPLCEALCHCTTSFPRADLCPSHSAYLPSPPHPKTPFYHLLLPDHHHYSVSTGGETFLRQSACRGARYCASGLAALVSGSDIFLLPAECGFPWVCVTWSRKPLIVQS